MRRFLGPAALAIGMLLAAGGLATAQDEVETRSSSTTWLGDTGLWFVPTAEILPAGKVSVSGYRANFDREQGQTDIAHFVGTFGVGVADRVEIFGSVRADTRIRRDSRPLFDASDPVFGGVLQDYPTLTDFWNGDDFGDIVFGGKINLLSEHRQQPAAVAIRGMVKAPTGNENIGKSTGEADFMFDFIASKNINDNFELSGFGGMLIRGEPAGISLGNSVRWGLGAGFPTSGRMKVFVELNGELPMNDEVVLTSALRGVDKSISPLISRIATPIDFNLGLQYQANNGMFVGAGFTYALGQERGTNDGTAPLIGFQVRLGYHPGVRRYVAPPPPPPADPPQNRPPTVTAECDPCEVEPGATSRVTAAANDPDGDPLTYRWAAPTGALNPTNQMATTWTAPNEEGPVPVTVTVDDGRGGTASDTATIRVVAPPAPPAREFAFEDVHFDFDRYTLRPGATRVLDEAISAMNDDDSLNLTLEGHTCNIGTSEYNQALGERRATAVRDYLTNRGIAANRLQTVTFGEERPMHDNAREESRRLNRRAALVVRVQ